MLYIQTTALTDAPAIKSWMAMEIVSPAAFLYTLSSAPLGSSKSLNKPSMILAALYLIHYTNRAVINPLRTPSRSKMHISVLLSAVLFNSINGSLMGAYISSSAAQVYLSRAFERSSFWAGVAAWTIGFVGNVYHDEILLNIRRKAQDKKTEDAKPHYAIPYGGLYRFISYPNYFSEWVEWTGYAVAAAPVPALLSGGITLMSPPWLFVWNEVLLMAPRAWRGHKWYHSKFPDYPKERKAVIPLIL